MKIKNKIISGIILSSLLAGGLFAANCEMMNKNDEMKKGEHPKCMMNKDCFDKKSHKSEFHLLKMFNELNLSAEQEDKIQKIIEESRKNIKSPNEAFSKDGFDKAKYVQIMSEKRDNMIKSQAEIIEKSYAILTPQQKEQLKVLMDLRKEKMDKK